jgi:hypothetical protein
MKKIKSLLTKLLIMPAIVFMGSLVASLNQNPLALNAATTPAFYQPLGPCFSSLMSL